VRDFFPYEIEFLQSLETRPRIVGIEEEFALRTLSDRGYCTYASLGTGLNLKDTRVRSKLTRKGRSILRQARNPNS